MRNALLAKCKIKRLDTTSLGHHGSKPIYVYVFLMQRSKSLLATEKKKEAKKKYVLIFSEQVLTRRNEDSPVVDISDTKDLDYIAAQSYVNELGHIGSRFK